ncbi:fused IMP cyclohydrolase; phosphoribosylaminoimidazolecarboxamide formyltransferase [Magnetospirillum sp. LM-5]|uniref:bifunctional phosphoribosylaminoimidazolecarboxamide formyltransferase/IMP cyclohydrolase n=1 Tax=Magnetospirillum sp. LM-5 TaxID=2681466 RepID=UPI00137F815D|nr:bifunctional phosphoribosylaminoimidazolecarboxamide formyltransferase/IMP cyclohydrolase [Magnetospirillum sp. LM-5]CAA7619101.1 fused IMP cyclohydrolase; phosphoribosylaminoimidazolecarboxamide formyltransferase [Magnetospirillum sp. LM-5]
MSDLRPIRRALFSVSDKTGLVEFARFLAERDVEILSTGGTCKALRDAGLTVVEVADYTGFPEMLDGRVKTLHPKVHGGLLGIRGNAEHEAAMAEHGINPIDLLVVNLYPFEATVAKGADYDTTIENIDIGGPAMIRAASKNHDSVAVVVDVEDYQRVMEEMTAHGGATTLGLRKHLAATAYARTGAYDAAISQWFARELGDTFPRRVVVAGQLKQSLRYGENPHQQAAFYVTADQRPGIATARQLQGKELSYNNLNDTDAAFELAAEFEAPTVAIIKHANPCGVATGPDIVSAYKAALACDPVSAFGGIIAINRKLDGATAEEICKLFTEVVIAPEADEAAVAAFAAKKNLRLLVTGAMPDPTSAGMTLRAVSGGYLFQNKDNGRVSLEGLKVVTKRAPTDQELKDLLFAFRVCKHVKSNAIIYVKDGCTVGIGAGQMSRVDSSRIAAWKSQEAATAAGLAQPGTVGSVVASDAFFPFADGLLAAAAAGATAIIQPGGSMRDAEVIAAADEKGLAMVFTGMRHFRH